MSDTLILGIVIPLITAISAWVTIWLNGRVAERLKNQILETNEKVDEYHKEINSKLTRLVEAEKTISHREGKAEGLAENK